MHGVTSRQATQKEKAEARNVDQVVWIHEGI